MKGEYNSSKQTGRGHVAYISEKTGLMKVREVEYAIIRGRAVFEGDIILNTLEGITAAKEVGAKHLKAGDVSRTIPDVIHAGDVLQGVVIVGAGVRWPGATIPYTIDPGLSNQARVTDAIAHWEANTPVRFRLRTSEADYVTFFSDPNGCASNVGRAGGQQGIWLASGCSTGNAIHEIGHTVGLWHEQSREDRNSHVTIHYGEHERGCRTNFDQQIADGDDVGPYDLWVPHALLQHGLFQERIGDHHATSRRIHRPAYGVEHWGYYGSGIYVYGVGVYYVGNVNTRELHLPSLPLVNTNGPLPPAFILDGGGGQGKRV